MTPQVLSFSEYHACGFLLTWIGPLEAYVLDVFNANYFLTCEQTFLSFMAVSVYGVVRVACLSRIWSGFSETTSGVLQRYASTRQKSYANDFVNAKSHAREKPLPQGNYFYKQVISLVSSISKREAHSLLVYHFLFTYLYCRNLLHSSLYIYHPLWFCRNSVVVCIHVQQRNLVALQRNNTFHRWKCTDGLDIPHNVQALYIHSNAVLRLK